VPTKLTGINSSSASAPVDAGRAAKRVADESSREQSPAGSSSDVHITDTASRLVSLEKAISDLPAVDAARVNAISGSIDNGSYAISPARIAAGMVQMEQALAAHAAG
jgi:flagellar biosynthesis anti-sigma factor FlgM